MPIIVDPPADNQDGDEQNTVKASADELAATVKTAYEMGRTDQRKRITEALESLDLLCRAEDTHGDTIRAHEVRDAVADLRADLADVRPGGDA